MDYDDHVRAVVRETDVLEKAFGAGPLDVPVPTCPDWVVRDLAKHVGEFTCFWTHVLCEGAGLEKTPFPDMPKEDVADWYRDLAHSLIDVLKATPPDTPIWTWVESDKHA
ncbi:MAG TPA: maleylpyruvate isomerase N-terminal domain-containing protein, partial [Acidimicrobiia bacterium]|nr:maleylpyruvate isomerase N-terminal domain-containing protein [Acidimicrobiia bacterium]